MNSSELFIISAQRSGSNWLHRCLAVHDEIKINGELNVSDILEKLECVKAGDSVAQEKLVNTGAYKVAARDYILHLMGINADVVEDSTEYRYLADKTAFPCVRSVNTFPEQYNYASVLNKYFEASKKILILRDVRDVVVSFSEWKKQPIGSLFKLTPRSFGFFIRHLSNWCLLHEKWLMDIQGDETWMVVRYESLKDSFSDTLKSIYGFLEIDVDDEFINDLNIKLYKIDSDIYQAENKSRGYGFFRNGAVGEWEEKFTWLHKVVFNLFFKARVEKIIMKVDMFN